MVIFLDTATTIFTNDIHTTHLLSQSENNKVTVVGGNVQNGIGNTDHK